MNKLSIHPRPSLSGPYNEVGSGLENGQKSEPECDKIKYLVINLNVPDLTTI